MIGFNNLGSKGWLGNQMFQYAALQGVARYHGYEFAAPPDDGTSSHNYGLFSVFEMTNCKNIQYVSGPTIEVNSFHFDNNFFETCPDEHNIVGFFQTEKYFLHTRKYLLEDFTVKDKINLPYKEYISIHVRRGDYLNYQSHHPVQTVDYYKRSVAALDSDLPIVVVSDDIPWCRENLDFVNYFSENQTRGQDMHIMISANHNIISNSSYSWWGAWLNDKPEKIVICPENWFGPAYRNYNMDDIRPKEWIKI